jgi:hypothetical protein
VSTSLLPHITLLFIIPAMTGSFAVGVNMVSVRAPFIKELPQHIATSGCLVGLFGARNPLPSRNL